jgi:HTH-type transcriptional regulator / antitoxin HigA
MDVKPLRNEQDYDWAAREVAGYFEVDPGVATVDGDRFEVLSILIKDYEDKHFAASHGDPVDVLHFAIAVRSRDRIAMDRGCGTPWSASRGSSLARVGCE